MSSEIPDDLDSLPTPWWAQGTELRADSQILLYDGEQFIRATLLGGARKLASNVLACEDDPLRDDQLFRLDDGTFAIRSVDLSGLALGEPAVPDRRWQIISPKAAADFLIAHCGDVPLPPDLLAALTDSNRSQPRADPVAANPDVQLQPIIDLANINQPATPCTKPSMPEATNKKGKRIQEKMAAIILKGVEACLDWTAEDWAKRLNCSTSMIVKTKAWKRLSEIRLQRLADKAAKDGAKVDRRRRSRRNRSSDSEGE